MLAPCKDCEKRVLGCHSSCEEYQEFRKEKDLDNAAKRTVWQEKITYTNSRIKRIKGQR